MKPLGSSTKRAWTLVEVLLLVGVLAILLAMVDFGPRPGAKQKAMRAACINNLRQASVAFATFAAEHDDKFPWKVPVLRGGSLESVETEQVPAHFRALSNHVLSAKVLACPADKQRAKTAEFPLLTNSNISYFIALTAQENTPGALLSGDRFVSGGDPSTRALQVFQPHSFIAWTNAPHFEKGCVAFADGTAQWIGTPELQALAKSNSTPVMRLAIP